MKTEANIKIIDSVLDMLLKDDADCKSKVCRGILDKIPLQDILRYAQIYEFNFDVSLIIDDKKLAILQSIADNINYEKNI